MLHMILGEAGTGKTEEVLRRIRQAVAGGQTVLLIVPEHASFEMERRAGSRLSDEELRHISILSFPRLAENIFRECGGLTHRPLDEVSRALLMREAVNGVQNELRLYRRQAAYQSFIPSMLETVGDFKRAGITPERLLELAEETAGGQLSEKLRDMQLIYGAFQALVQQRFHDPLDALATAARRAGQKNWFADKYIWVDGFDYFSVSEREMLLLMLQTAPELTLSMTCNGLDTQEDIFLYQKKFLLHLRMQAQERGIGVGAPVYLRTDRRHRSASLAGLQRAFTSPGAASPAGDGMLRLIEADTVYGEMRFAAAEICRLVREEGLRYQDCVILCRSMDRYENARMVLAEYGIPYYYSKKQSILFSALPSFLLSALEAAYGAIRTAELLRLARSSASGLSPQDAGRLENYSYIWEIAGDDWLRPFTNNPEGMSEAAPEDYAAELAAVESARRTITEPLQELRQGIARCTGEGFAAAVYRYITHTGALQHLTEGKERQEQETVDRQWNSIVDVLDLFCDFYGGKTLTAREVTDLFRLALSRVDLGSVPNTVDQVILAESDRVRLQSPRAVFVLGVNEGVFPAAGQNNGLFSNREREQLNACGAELPVVGVQSALREQFVLYSALTAPAERLFITYARQDLQGDTQLSPAACLVRLLKPLGIRPQKAAELSAEFWVVNPRTAKYRYAAALAKNPAEAALLAALLERLGEKDCLSGLNRTAADAPAGDISAVHARQLLGEKLHLAPTAIDSFYQCPYLFFCDKMLRIRPRQKVEYSPFESGSAIHYVFQQMVDRHGGKALAALSDAEMDRQIREYLREYIARMIPDPQAVTARFHYQFERLSLMLRVILRHMAQELAQSEFVTAATEVGVGEGGAVASPPLHTAEGTPILLRGSIDRVDLFRTPEQDYLRVIDYKSGTKDFRLEEVAYGLNMQMLIYLFAACGDENRTFGTPQPAGVLYLPSRLEAVDTTVDASAQSVAAEVSESLRMKGMLLEDETVLRAMEHDLAGVYIPPRITQKGAFSKNSQVYSREAFQKIREVVYRNITAMGSDLQQGRVAPCPVRDGHNDPCRYCPYTGLCNNTAPEAPHKEIGEKEGEE